MRYYLSRGRTKQIEEKFWTALKQINPDVKELTKQEYEKNRGIKQTGTGDQGDNNGGKAVGQNTVTPTVTSLSGKSTRKEIIAELLKRRGHGSKTALNRKNKKVLLEML